MPDHDRWPPGGGDPSLNEINRIDRFIDALATNQTAYSTDRDEAELAFLLADWRDGVRDAPLAATMTPQEAADALRTVKTSRRHIRSLALVGSVAAAVLCLGGFGTAVYGAGTGDSLYGVRTMLFGDRQVTRDDQVSLASAQLAQVQQLVDEGQWQAAQDKLVALTPTVQSVGAPEDQHDLTEQYNALTYKVIQQDSAATLPPSGEPMPPLPPLSALTLLPVPVVVESNTPTASTSTSSESTESQEPNPTSGSTSTSTDSPSTTTSPSTATTPSTTTAPSTTTSSPSTTSVPSTTTSPSTTSAPPPSSSSSSTTTTTTVIARDATPSAVAPPSAAAPPPAAARPVAVAPPVVAPPTRVVSIPSSAPAVQSSEAAPQQEKPAPPPSAQTQQREAPEAPVTTTVPRSAGTGE